MGVSTTRIAVTLMAAVQASNDGVDHYTYVDLLCDCGREAGLIGDTDDEARVVDLVEHALFDHASSRDILIERKSRLLTAFEMRRAAGLGPLTEAEERWRRTNPIE